MDARVKPAHDESIPATVGISARRRWYDMNHPARGRIVITVSMPIAQQTTVSRNTQAGLP